MCIAPMMECTDRHFRYFLRLLTKHAFLYTEMVTTGALLHGDVECFLAHDSIEYPLALQLGGSDPLAMASCTQMAAQIGFNEVNINAGCPSDRVQSGRFGACLMAEPEIVADCVASMREASDLPVTVKTRIGIDDQDSHQALNTFVDQVSRAGCQTFIIHARKAWLKGLNPKQNRDVPPLNYARVIRLKQDFPQLEIILNGGIVSLQQAIEIGSQVDGVMIGREGYSNPYMLHEVDHLFYSSGQEYCPSPHEVIVQYLPYVERQLGVGVRLSAMTRHLMGLFNGMPGAKAWRRHLSEQANRPNADVSVIEKAASLVNQAGFAMTTPNQSDVFEQQTVLTA